jgi:hypothetical protein
MKLKSVKTVKESAYPTYLNYLRNHKKELSVIAAGVGLLLTQGCKENNKPDKSSVPKPPIIRPVDKGVDLEGDMATATPPKTQACPTSTPMLGGKIKAPTPPPIRGISPAPKPIEIKTKGKMPPPRMMGIMVAPKQQEKK